MKKHNTISVEGCNNCPLNHKTNNQERWCMLLEEYIPNVKEADYVMFECPFASDQKITIERVNK